MVKKPISDQESDFQKRKEAFLQNFAREAPQVRSDIIKDISAYNTLLSLQAQSFEEFALQHYAIVRNEPYNRNNPPIPDCPFCDKHDNVIKKSKGLYRCSACERKFSANYNSISSGTKCDALTWMKFLHCLLEGFGMSKTCDFCNISNMTYYHIRNRLFYAMQLLLEDLRLYGVIQVDNTFIRCSYKGSDLKESEFDEDSIFFDASFKPRAASKRGRTNRMDEVSNNTICVFAAIDDRGHVITRFAGIGATNYALLKQHVPQEKYLLTVPKHDPFKFSRQKPSKPPTSVPGDETIMVADKEAAIQKYATHLGVQFESHVYRINNAQISAPNRAHNIQRVNALHQRLKAFLRKHHYVSSKYLPGYLILFEFIENTGASEEAITRLFQILSTPNTNRGNKFFEEMFSVPNYLEHWLTSDTPLSKLPYNKILAFYLFDQKKSEDPNAMSMQEIELETGYSAPTIRKLYRELNAAGYRDLILEYFNKRNKKKEKGEKSKQRKPSAAPETLNPTVLAMYDEFIQNRLLPASQRKRFEDLLADMNKKYGTNYKRTNLMMKFKYIETHTDRPAIPTIMNIEDIQARKYLNIALAVYDRRQEIILSYRTKGEKPPYSYTINQQIAEEFGLTAQTIVKYIATARKYKKEHMTND